MEFRSVLEEKEVEAGSSVLCNITLLSVVVHCTVVALHCVTAERMYIETLIHFEAHVS